MLENPCGLAQVKIIAQKMYPQAKNFLPYAYHDAINKKIFSHNIWLWFRNHITRLRTLRVCAKFFDLFPIVYIPRHK